MIIPRPLTTEPLALDLVNTRWRGGSGFVDAIATPEGAAAWLAEHQLDSPADAQTIKALQATREAILQALQGLEDERALTPLNAVLARGKVRVELGVGGMSITAVQAPEHWRSAWQAANNLVELLQQGSSRIRACEHENCVLWFYDTSRNGRRRWCSMDGCGNRAKAARFRSKTP